MHKVLIYTVSRANSITRVKSALESLHHAQSTAGHPHEWILWANAPGIHEASKLSWLNGQRWNDGINTGQHVALSEILKYARSNNFDFILKADDDLQWLTKNWLKKLLEIESSCFNFSNRHQVIGASVVGLKNPIPVIAKIKVAKHPLKVVSIIGGACRLHHISFFDDYIPDCRRALGAGGDVSIAQHAEKIGVGMLISHHVRVAHRTEEMESADPEYFNEHQMFQCIPFVPKYENV